MGNVFPNVHSAKVQIVCRLNMSKTAVLGVGHFHHLNFLHVHVLYIWLVAILKGGGGQPASMHALRVKNLGSDHQNNIIGDTVAIVMNFLPTSICSANLRSALLAFSSIVYMYKINVHVE